MCCFRKITLILFVVLVLEIFNVSTSDLQTSSVEESRKKNGGKKGTSIIPLLLIPFMIQAKIIPLMLLGMKLVAAKALLIGKVAMFIIFLNVVRNAVLGDNIDEQYEYQMQQEIAQKHYGYNGGPEYGAWVNRRMGRIRIKQRPKPPLR